MNPNEHRSKYLMLVRWFINSTIIVKSKGENEINIFTVNKWIQQNLNKQRILPKDSKKKFAKVFNLLISGIW